MTSNQSETPAIDLESGIMLSIALGVFGGITASSIVIGLFFGVLGLVIYLLYRIWWTLELIATEL